jgi:hypothetical protein
MKPFSNLKSVAKHAAAWIIWFAFNSITVFTDGLSKFGLIDWLQLTFNYVSLVLVFYAVGYIIKNMLNRISFVKYQNLNGLAALKYLMKIELLFVLLVMLFYISIAIFLDSTYFGYEYPSIVWHIDKRLARVLAYVVAGAGYAYFLYYKRRQEILSRAKNIRIKNLEIHNQKIKNSFEELLATQSFN